VFTWAFAARGYPGMQMGQMLLTLDDLAGEAYPFPVWHVADWPAAVIGIFFCSRSAQHAEDLYRDTVPNPKLFAVRSIEDNQLRSRDPLRRSQAPGWRRPGRTRRFRDRGQQVQPRRGRSTGVKHLDCRRDTPRRDTVRTLFVFITKKAPVKGLVVRESK
jgi:hypothetical protein